MLSVGMKLERDLRGWDEGEGGIRCPVMISARGLLLDAVGSACR